MKKLLLLLAMCFAFLPSAMAQLANKPVAGKAAAKTREPVPPEKAKPLQIPRFDKPPVIDGKLDDEVWKQAVMLRDFYQIHPGDNIAPTKPTEVLLGYDSKFLYFGFHCYDEPDKVRASVAARDNVFGEDNVRVFLDTYNDQRKAYVLGWNPLCLTVRHISPSFLCLTPDSRLPTPDSRLISR